MHSRVSVILACVTTVALTSCGSSKGSAESADANGAGTTQELVETLSLLAGDALSATAIGEWVGKIERNEATTDALIQHLIQSSSIGERVAPSLLFTSFVNAKNYYALPAMYTLQQVAGTGGPPIYYLREPCSASEAVDVRPWWDLGRTVKVCPDSYRPERWTLDASEHSYRTRMVLGCDGQVGSPEKEDQPLCGCGPNLLRCLKDGEQYLAMQTSMAKEVRETTAYIVNHDMKLSRLFTSNQSVRDRNAEYLYQRGILGALEGEGVEERIRKLRDWPEGGIWAEREELVTGQHAGVLTSNQLLTWAPDRRQRQRLFFEVMWCAGRDSFGATTEKIFEVSDNPNLAFTNDSWERLAHTDTCTKCHARLDYGFQFFMGYPDARATSHIMPNLVLEGEGLMYGNDINDPRGSARLTPVGFARHAVEQPEFSTCMASQISNYVLGPDAPRSSHLAVQAAFQKSGEFRSTLGTALKLYVDSRVGSARAEPLAAQVATKADATETTLPASVVPDAALHALMEEHCLDCHDDDAIAFDTVANSYGTSVYLGGESLSRPLVVRMLDQVAYGNMPRGKLLEHSVREEFVADLIAQMWPPGPGRDRASDYYLGQMRALPGHQIDVVLQSTREFTAGSEDNEIDPIEWGVMERSIYADQNILAPGYLSILALESAEDCRASVGDDDKAFAECLQTVLSLGRLAR